MTTGNGPSPKARAEVVRLAIGSAVAGVALVTGALLASAVGVRGGATAAVTVGATVLLLAVVSALSPLFGSRGGRGHARSLPPSRRP